MTKKDLIEKLKSYIENEIDHVTDQSKKRSDPTDIPRVQALNDVLSLIERLEREEG